MIDELRKPIFREGKYFDIVGVGPVNRWGWRRKRSPRTGTAILCRLSSVRPAPFRRHDPSWMAAYSTDPVGLLDQQPSV
ncbi:hypothetical protein [Actinophytocola xinjiangensis]|uniref:hypothetical protein n=1 Tax=Actinophytocola xinjiangensis TaxID=485602 RepID=UPI001FE41343|nr:hypothetical protein [Actinophytocola xinjiangensis]